MNGNKGKDEEEEITFIGKTGNSVIDYAIYNAKTWEKVKSMKVGNRTESDHRLIEITLKKKIERKRKESEESRDIEDWLEEE